MAAAAVGSRRSTSDQATDAFAQSAEAIESRARAIAARISVVEPRAGSSVASDPTIPARGFGAASVVVVAIDVEATDDSPIARSRLLIRRVGRRRGVMRSFSPIRGVASASRDVVGVRRRAFR